MPTRKLTNKQFEALAKLSRFRNGPAQEAARLILVEGYTTTDAAKEVGCIIQSASNAYLRCIANLKLIDQVVSQED